MARKTSSVRARMEPEVKEKAEQVFRQLGLSTSEAINLFFRQVQLQRGLPFELRVPNAETREAIREVYENEDLERYDTPEELFEALDI